MIDAIEQLKACLLNEDVILFTGAGFSFEATNGLGDDLPSGKTLKEWMLTEIMNYAVGSPEIKQFDNCNLYDVVEFCQSEDRQQAVDDYLRSKFENCSPRDFHRVILAYPWKRIYTTNIDDLVENTLPRGRVFVQNQLNVRKPRYTQDCVEYIKLHGCVRNPACGFIFGRSQYMKRIVDNDNALVSLYNNDIQTENFVFIGFDDDEIDFDAYFKSRQARGTRKGKLFFINPNMHPIFVNKIRTKGGIHIPITTRDFSSIISEVNSGRSENESRSRDISGFLHVNQRLKLLAAEEPHDSKLYFGEVATWQDIYYDWDFNHPINSKVRRTIEGVSEGEEHPHTMIAIYGSVVSGKTTSLKRIGAMLCDMGFRVYEYNAREFNVRIFSDACAQMDDVEKIALIVDNAPYYYRELEQLIRIFPKDKTLAVVGAGSSRTHSKKKYSVSGLPGYFEYDITTAVTGVNRTDYYNDIISHLENKNKLSSLISFSREERIKEIKRHPDISSFLYSLNYSPKFKARFVSYYHDDKKDGTFNKSRDVLTALALFQSLDIPGIPMEMLVAWKEDNYQEIMEFIQEYVRWYEDYTVSLRNKFLTQEIMKLTNEKEKEDTIVEILQIIAPLVKASSHTQWNIIQERLIKVRDLRKILRFSPATIERILSRIENHYSNDSNYWIQAGIYLQEKDEYSNAHVKLSHAVGLAPHSYLAQHALARNYLLWANSCRSKEEAATYFKEGKESMLSLIVNRDEGQTRAYSTHCYVSQIIKYWLKFKIAPSSKDIKDIQNFLDDLYQSGRQDYKTQDVINQFYAFVKKMKLEKMLNTLSMEQLAIFSSAQDIDEKILDRLSEEVY